MYGLTKMHTLGWKNTDLIQFADTDFSTIQTILPDDSPIMQSYYKITNKDSDEYNYLIKHYPHTWRTTITKTYRCIRYETTKRIYTNFTRILGI